MQLKFTDETGVIYNLKQKPMKKIYFILGWMKK